MRSDPMNPGLIIIRLMTNQFSNAYHDSLKQFLLPSFVTMTFLRLGIRSIL